MTRIKRLFSSKPVLTSIAGMLLVPLIIWTSRANAWSDTRIFARNSTRIPAIQSDDASAPRMPPVQPDPMVRSVVTGLVPSTQFSIVPEPMQPAPPVPEIEPDNSGILNLDRDFALGMIESGNNDRAVGKLGEVSRYQIMPSVWKHYSDSRDYRDQESALDVARQHWSWLHAYFEARARRAASDFDMYVLWNTRHGYYASKGFNPERLHPVVRERAERFANLVERGAE